MKNLKALLRDIPFVRACQALLQSVYMRLTSNAILLYHRVAEVRDDPLLLAVTPERFNEQLARFASQGYRFVSVAEMLQDVPAGDKRLAITFDDGYADNLHNALPILEKFGAPATIFVVSGKVGSNEPFYWEKGIRTEDQGRCVTHQELQRLAAHPLIELGAHTMTHPRLSALPPKEQEREIRESKHELEQLIGRPVRYFAYPFGSKDSFEQDTTRAVEQSGFAAAFANWPGKLGIRTNRFAVPRWLMRPWN